MNQTVDARASRQFDLSGVKIIDSFSNVEVRLRLAIVCPLAVLLSWWLNDWTYALLVLAYLVTLSIYFRIVAGLPRRVVTKQLALLMISGFVVYSVFMSASVLLWMNDSRIAQIFGLMLWFSAMLNAISPRAAEPVFLLLDLFVIMLTGLFMLYFEFLRTEDSGSFLVVFVSFSALIAYHLQSVKGIARFRGSLRRLRNGEEEADRQRAIGQLVGGVAHDFNNLLTVVIGNLQLFHEVNDSAEKRELLDEAERAARRGADLTGQLLAFSRKSQLLPEPVTIDQIVQDVKPLVMRLLGEKHTLTFHILPDIPLIEVDLSKLQAVLLNLILNARDAMPDGGAISFHAAPGYHMGRRMLSIKIADKGVGIPPEIMHQVFEPYFTTKPVGKGSGLGLSMAKGFVEQSGGRLELTSKVNRGTQVILHFPAYFPRS